MNVSVVEVVGLIGVVLVISTGKIFNPLREYLSSFLHPLNPSRWVADLISCSMCTGVWVGVLWGIVHAWSWSSIIVFSGVLSLSSFAASELLGLVGVLTLRGTRGMVASQAVTQQRVSMLARRKPPEEPRKVGPGNDISEEEADALLDKETEQADLMLAPLGAANKRGT